MVGEQKLDGKRPVDCFSRVTALKLTGESVDGELQGIRSGRWAKAAPGPKKTTAERNPHDRVSRESAIAERGGPDAPVAADGYQSVGCSERAAGQPGRQCGWCL